MLQVIELLFQLKLSFQSIIAVDKTETASDKTGTARNRTETARDITGRPKYETGKGA